MSAGLPEPDRWYYERSARERGYRFVAGLDEAGRGPLAGPVVAGCVILPEDPSGWEAVNDSKQLSATERREIFLLILERARAVGVGIVDSHTIDRLNILQATFLAMQRAVLDLSRRPDYLLIDGNRHPAFDLPVEAVIGGDGKSLAIGAASIVAKVTRDRIMEDYDSAYPHWGFARHKGYGTAEHMEAIRRHGICDLHRRSFAPVSQLGLCLT